MTVLMMALLLCVARHLSSIRSCGCKSYRLSLVRICEADSDEPENQENQWKYFGIIVGYPELTV